MPPFYVMLTEILTAINPCLRAFRGEKTCFFDRLIKKIRKKPEFSCVILTNPTTISIIIVSICVGVFSRQVAYFTKTTSAFSPFNLGLIFSICKQDAALTGSVFFVFNRQAHRSRVSRNSRWNTPGVSRCRLSFPQRYKPFRFRPFGRYLYGQIPRPAGRIHHRASPNQKR